MQETLNYCCTIVECRRATLVERDGALCCPNGHVFPYANGTKAPVFASEAEDANEYAIKNAAQVHDNSLRWVFDTFGVDEPSVRRRLASRLPLKKGQTVLITGVGAGNDLPYLAERMAGDGVIYAQDIAKQMLLAGVERFAAKFAGSGIKIHFSVSDATNLPFEDDVFDAAYHFGGINLFPSIRAGIAEMNRVVKPSGKIVLSDEGLAPWLKQTEYGRMLTNNNALYAYDAPLELLPDTAQEVKLSWEVGNCFYVIEFTVSDRPLPINIDVPHVGKRGGSIRTRYFGKLEGIDPTLRDKVYAEAEKRGLSRVAFIESLLKSSLKN